MMIKMFTSRDVQSVGDARLDNNLWKWPCAVLEMVPVSRLAGRAALPSSTIIILYPEHS
jgi:hypothetical protein